MNQKILYSALTLYTCANINNVDKISSGIEDLCPKIKTGMELEIRKDFNKDKNDFMKTYSLYIEDKTIIYKESTTSEKSLKLNIEKQELETTGTLNKNKRYKSSVLGQRNEKYYKQLNNFLEKLKSFDNPRWINFKLNDVIECIQTHNK